MLSLRFISCFLLLGGILAGCSDAAGPSATPFVFHTPTPVPITKYFNEQLGIAAQLPGTGWDLDTDKSDANYEYYLSVNADQTLLFVIRRFKGPSPYKENELSQLVQNHLENYTEATPTSETTFHGYPAVEIEGNPISATDTRYINYWFVNKGQLYWVSAAASTGRWDIDGKKQVEQILDSVAVH